MAGSAKRKRADLEKEIRAYVEEVILRMPNEDLIADGEHTLERKVKRLREAADDVDVAAAVETIFPREWHRLTASEKSQINIEAMSIDWKAYTGCSPSSHGPPIGLRNEQNFCYMNASLQIIFSLPALREAVLEVKTGFEDKKPENATLEAQLVHELQVLLHDLGTQSERKNDRNPLEPPRELECILAKLHSDFKLGDQNDTHSFLTKVIEDVVQLEEGGAGAKRIQELLMGEKVWTLQLKDPTLRLVKRQGNEVFMGPSELLLEIDGFKNMSESLANQNQKQDLVGENQYEDDEHGHQDAERTIKFSKLPPILFLTLKRFDSSRMKLRSRFTFDPTIDLQETGSEGELQEMKVSYDLHAVTVHSGQDERSGHYWTFINREEEGGVRWYKLNDASVSVCDPGFQDVFQGTFEGTNTAYVLCYVRVDKKFEVFNDAVVKADTQKLMEERQRHMRHYQADERHRFNTRQSENMQICPKYSDHLFSSTFIDSKLTGFGGSEMQVLQHVYEEMAYKENKMDFFDGDAKFAMRHLDFRTKAKGMVPSVENIIVGDCQSGKSAEAVWSAWCSAFVMGCVPIVLVRNSGGIQGLIDMRNAFVELNKRVVNVAKRVIKEMQVPMRPEDFRIEILDQNMMIELTTRMRRVQLGEDQRLRPIAYLMLYNKPQMMKLAEPIQCGPKNKAYAATVVDEQNEQGQWQVRFTSKNDPDCGDHAWLDEEYFTKSSVDAKIANGKRVEVKKPDELRIKPGLLEQIAITLDIKDTRVRAVFIIDEGDLAVGDPTRQENVVDRIQFYDVPSTLQDFMSEKGLAARGGVRAYAFGSVYITATPAALFMSIFCSLVCPLCEQALEAGKGGVRVNCENRHHFHSKCLKPHLQKDDSDDFKCPSCEKMEAEKEEKKTMRHGGSPGTSLVSRENSLMHDLSAPDNLEPGREQDLCYDTESDDEEESEEADTTMNDEGDEKDEEEEGKGTGKSNGKGKQKNAVLSKKNDVKHVNFGTDVASIEVNVVRTDRPTNYTCYPEFILDGAEGQQPHKIERVLVSERLPPKLKKLEVYQLLWTGDGRERGITDKFSSDQCTQAGWDNMIKQLDANKKVDIEGWDGFSMRKDSKGYINVAGPKNDEIFIEARTLHQKQTTPPQFELERDALATMIRDMHRDENSPFRHALIWSDQTAASCKKQAYIQKGIWSTFFFAELAVATLDSYGKSSQKQGGIKVLFTEKALRNHPGLLEKAKEEARKHLVKFYQSQAKDAQDSRGTLKIDKNDPHAKAQGQVVDFNDSWGVFPSASLQKACKAGFRIKEANINIFYSTLKTLGLRKSVVIAGSIGGRGVSYHDMRHETLLTDMYSSISYNPLRPVAGHGETLIQCLGRLNTIMHPPRPEAKFRLWAPPSLHKVHQAQIEYLNDFVQQAIKTRNGLQALKSVQRHVTGTEDKFSSLMLSRQSFSKPPSTKKIKNGAPRLSFQDSRSEGEILFVDMPLYIASTPRGEALKAWEAPPHPGPGARCTLVPVWPHGLDAEAAADVRQASVWSSGSAFDPRDHIIWRVTIPDTMMEEDSQMMRRIDEHNQSFVDYLVAFRKPHAQHDMNYNEFKSRKAAYEFLLSGALGDTETATWTEHIPNVVLAEDEEESWRVAVSRIQRLSALRAPNGMHASTRWPAKNAAMSGVTSLDAPCRPPPSATKR